MSITDAGHIAWKTEEEFADTVGTQKIVEEHPPLLFKVGDLVRLKSGGPRMTVEDCYEGPGKSWKTEVMVAWFDGSAPMRDRFKPECLEPMPKAE